MKRFHVHVAVHDLQQRVTGWAKRVCCAPDPV
jgi:hypothetical protein